MAGSTRLTPQQKRANEAFAKAQDQKRGKPATQVVKRKEKAQKSPVNKIWLYMLLFVVCGGIVFELLRMILGAGASFFS